MRTSDYSRNGHKTEPSTFDYSAWLNAASLADDLTHREFRVLIRLSRYADYKTGGNVRPSITRLSEDVGIFPRHLSGADGVLGSLVAKGWLVKVREHTRRDPAWYRLAYGSHRESEVTATVTPEPIREVTATVTPAEPEVTATVRSEVTPTVRSEVTATVTQSTQDLPKTTSKNIARPPHATLDIVDAEIVPDPPATHDQVQALIARTEATLDEAGRLAALLARRLRSNGVPGAAADRKWATAITEILNRGATPAQVEHVINWATAHPFWSGRITDAKALAFHYDAAVSQASAALRQQANGNGGGRAPRWQEERNSRHALWAEKYQPQDTRKGIA